MGGSGVGTGWVVGMRWCCVAGGDKGDGCVGVERRGGVVRSEERRRRGGGDWKLSTYLIMLLWLSTVVTISRNLSGMSLSIQRKKTN